MLRRDAAGSAVGKIEALVMRRDGCWGLSFVGREPSASTCSRYTGRWMNSRSTIVRTC